MAAPAELATTRARRVRLAPWQGIAHVVSVALAVVLARFAVFDVVQFLVRAVANLGSQSQVYSRDANSFPPLIS